MTAQKHEYRFAWVEWIKAVALVWIFLNHAAERVFGFPLISNPTADWPPLADRLAQLSPLQGYGINGILVNLFRYVGWFGDQGVQLFIIISGFGLTWGLLQRGQKDSIPLREFYTQRLARIYPLWWGAHIVFFAAWLITGRGLPFTELESWISFIGLRITPQVFYYFSPAWWYFILIIQLYLVFPLLWAGLQRLGPTRFLLIASAIAIGVRATGLLVFTDYLDVWQRGGIFITRLPEFAFGMALASWMRDNRPIVESKLTSSLTFVIAIFVYFVGLALSLNLLGMAVAPFLLGVSAFVILYNLLWRALRRMPGLLTSIGVWIGVHSYSLYLMHHPIISRLIPEGTGISLSLVVRLAAAAAGTFFLALILEFGTEWATKTLRNSLRSRGAVGTILRAGLVGFAVAALLLSAELLVRKFAPQEIFGWGERSALEISDEFGWRLKPGATTRLRWQSYDYTVTANSLGFPGTEYPPDKPAGVQRIMVTGDAFSSAEGVNTESAWPRLLEDGLTDRSGMQVQVLNFAMTGYGPNQYAAVVDAFLPVYEPDLVIVELFVNDLDDVFWTNEQFQQSIGFFEPSQTGLYSYLRLEHLRSFLRFDVLDPLIELISNQPQTKGYFLGNFALFETRRQPELIQASTEVSDRLEKIKVLTDEYDSSLLVVLVPASIQVCEPNELDYYPKHVEFSNPEQYSPELPQELLSAIGTSLDIYAVDLRSAFRGAQECPYQPSNMHWTEYGNKLVADYLASYLTENDLLGDAP